MSGAVSLSIIKSLVTYTHKQVYVIQVMPIAHFLQPLSYQRDKMPK